jgi:hypothetical protein
MITEYQYHLNVWKILLKNFARTVFLSIFLLNLFYSSVQAAIFDIEAHGVYGGFWRDLYIELITGRN